MKLALGVTVLLCLAARGSDDGPGRAVVVPFSVEVSQDRQTVTVATHYAASLKCAQDAAGANLVVNGETATVTVFVTNRTHRDYCLLDCGLVVQTISLDRPLPAGVRFVAPQHADPGACSKQE